MRLTRKSPARESSFLDDLPDAAIDEIVEAFAAAPSPMSSIVIEFFHGAVCGVEVSATAVPHRMNGYNLGIFGQWTDEQTSDQNVEWTRNTYNALEPFRAGRRYVNYLSSDDGDAVRTAYGPNYARLAQIKRQYDPDNIFHCNHNINPESS